MDRKSHHSGQVIYFSHGGGPLPILGDPSHQQMVAFMRDLPAFIRRPEAVVVFSAHWEEDIVTIQSGEQPGILYDYYGFPEDAYRIEYPCRGDKALAGRIAGLLASQGIPYRLDDRRPYDHGSYIPLKLIYPDAGIPVLQVSLMSSLDPSRHLDLGRALRPLLDENVLVIGSGFSFHNMRRFDFSGRTTADPVNDAFQNRLIEVCCREKDEANRLEQLGAWVSWPGARYCHPREEHLLPLMVCAGLAVGPGITVFDDTILGKRAVAILWPQTADHGQ